MSKEPKIFVSFISTRDYTSGINILGVKGQEFTTETITSQSALNGMSVLYSIDRNISSSGVLVL